MSAKKLAKGLILRFAGKFPPAAWSIRFMYSRFFSTGVGGFAVIRDDEGRVLAHELWDGGLNMPGGSVNGKGRFLGIFPRPTEKPDEAAKREALEETGLVVEITSALVCTHPIFLFETKVVRGELKTNEETKGFVWLSKEDIERNPEQIRGGKGSMMFTLFEIALT